jgi:AcrR family transcriptional regulator
MNDRSGRPSAARERLLETADRLFSSEGIRAVGIDRIIAEANVAKMTLYAHFASKDELILAALRYREAKVLAFFEEAIARYSRRKDPLQAFFAALKELLEQPDFRGCPFLNAAAELADAEHPGMTFVREHKKRFREMLHGLVQRSLGRSSTRLTAMVSLLVEGAILSAVVHRSSAAADTARAAALMLVQAEQP